MNFAFVGCKHRVLHLLIGVLPPTFSNVRFLIIAMSGGGQIESEFYLECAQSFGAEHTFAKPISRQKLLSAVKELIAMDPATLGLV